jgi:UDP-GlcNAc3NAcA epimerase
MTTIGRIVSVIGARPQFVKASAVSRALRMCPGVRDVLLHTGQHYDENMSSIFFAEMDIPTHDCNIGVGSGLHEAQTGMMLEKIEEILVAECPDRVVVYGDTNSTLAGALAPRRFTYLWLMTKQDCGLSIAECQKKSIG